MTNKQYPPLPVPYGYTYEFADPLSGDPIWRSNSGMWNGQTSRRSQGTYTEDQMRAYVDADRAMRAAPPYDHGPQATTIAEAARDVGKWLNERPNRPLDLRHVAMLVHYAQQEQTK